MKLKRIAIVLAAAAGIICAVCLALMGLTMLFHTSGYEQGANLFGSYLMYLLGYDFPEPGSFPLYLFLAVFGIVGISLCTSMFTDSIITKEKALLICPKLPVWESPDFGKKNVIGLSLTNFSKEDLIMIEISVSASDKDNHNHSLDETFRIPLLKKKTSWEKEIEIENSFFMNALYDFYRDNSDGKLYFVFQYQTSKSGTPMVQIQEYDRSSIVPMKSRQFMQYKQADVFWKKGMFLPLPQEAVSADHEDRESLISRIRTGTMHLNPTQVCTAGSGTIRNELKKLESGDGFRLTFEFERLDPVPEGQKWAMAYFRFLPTQDWRYYFEHDGFIQFKVGERENIDHILIELKDLNYGLRETIRGDRYDVDENPETEYRFSLCRDSDIRRFENLNELCFLLPYEVTERNKGYCEIYDVELRCPEKTTI